MLREDGHEETLGALNKAVQLADAQIDADEALPQLGEAWVGEEALAVAIYCALTADSFRNGVLMAVNHDGDSDTTGSLVGQMLGATYGKVAIPRDWLTTLEMRGVIEELARDIAGHRDWNLDYMSDDYDEYIVDRYPGG